MNTKPIDFSKLKNKIKHHAGRAGKELVYHVFVAFYTLRSPQTPAWCKTVLLGALGYFLTVIDGIPDLTPVLGYTDDLSLMIAALGTASRYITPEIKQRAQEKSDRYFPAEIEAEEKQDVPSTRL